MSNTHPKLGLAAVALAALSLGLSCASSGGGSYGDSRSSESSAASRARAAGNSSKPAPAPQAPDSHDDGGDSGGGLLFALLFGAKPQTPPPIPSGTLAVIGLPSGASLFIDGNLELVSTIALPVGEHEVRVSRFGYEDFVASSTVFEGTRAELKVELQSAPFSVRGVEASPEAFDPGDPGFLGGCG
ncbi:MAG TPA: PEGA domain-containing protein, partial [Rectinemataceae bacterium]|nr:PEGA domain-containing protein [Rectinemataceae bacterium]